MALDTRFVAEALRDVGDEPGRPAGPLGGRLLHVAVSEGRVAVRADGAALQRRAMESLAAEAYERLSQRCAAAGESLIAFTLEYSDEHGAPLHAFRFGQRPAAAAAQSAPPRQGAPAGHQPISGLRPAPDIPLPGVKHIIAVGAGKGGVGKSSIAVNLAVGLARRNFAVGLMDGDIYGPSIPTMLGLHEQEQSVIGGMLQPFYVHGVKTITIGKLVDPDRPLIWRGPMAHGAFKQLVEQTQWGDLDYMIIDLPPGTGDVSLTMSQMLQLTGAVVVCTPQRVAQDDALRAVRMFQQLGIDILGIVENMSVFIGDDGKEYDIFGRGGAEKMAARLNLPFLGAVPITMALRENSDKGDPTANFAGSTPLSRALESLVDAVERQCAMAAMRQGKTKPTLRIS